MNSQSVTDRVAIGLSFLCTLHCLVLPVLVALLPSLTAFAFADESFHLWMLVAVLPISVFALTMGCRKHKRYQILWVGFSGLAVMISAVVFGHDFLGEAGEKALTVVGAAMVAYGHFLNQKLCRAEECSCHD